MHQPTRKQHTHLSIRLDALVSTLKDFRGWPLAIDPAVGVFIPPLVGSLRAGKLAIPDLPTSFQIWMISTLALWAIHFFILVLCYPAKRANLAAQEIADLKARLEEHNSEPRLEIVREIRPFRDNGAGAWIFEIACKNCSYEAPKKVIVQFLDVIPSAPFQKPGHNRRLSTAWQANPDLPPNGTLPFPVFSWDATGAVKLEVQEQITFQLSEASAFPDRAFEMTIQVSTDIGLRPDKATYWVQWIPEEKRVVVQPKPAVSHGPAPTGRPQASPGHRPG